jgi:hypothetical protein
MREVSPLLIFVLLAASMLPLRAATAFSSVIISEVAWMGTTTSTPNNEWIELSNPTSEPFDLNGWTLVAEDGTPSIALSGIIPAGGHFLLERTSDETVPGITADQIYTGALSNSGEHLILRDRGGTIIDSVDGSSGWPAGDNATKQTMERGADGNWLTSLNPGGTPKAPNSVWQTSESPSPSSSPPPTPSPSPTPTPTPSPLVTPVPPPQTPPPPTTFTGTLRLSEILPDPRGNDREGEFVEIENTGESEVSLDGWQIRSGTSLKLTGRLAPHGLRAFLASETNLPTLSNSGDTVELIDPIGVRRDGVTYKETAEGFALARTSSGTWEWTDTPTPGAPNVFTTASLRETPLPTDTPLLDAPSLLTTEISESHENDTTMNIAPPIPTKAPQGNGETVLSTSHDGDGRTLAAALRTQPQLSQKQEWSILLAAGGSLLLGVIVFMLRVYGKRRREQAFVFEEEVTNDERSM